VLCFKLKIHENPFGGRVPSRVAGGAYSALEAPRWIKGRSPRGRRGNGKEYGQGGREKEWTMKGEDRKGEKERGKEH